MTEVTQHKDAAEKKSSTKAEEVAAAEKKIQEATVELNQRSDELKAVQDKLKTSTVKITTVLTTMS